MKKNHLSHILATLAGLSTLLLTGCSTSQVRSSQTALEERMVIQQVSRQAPGVVEYVWEEPMVNVVDVPPGLDPEGHYYRPAHQEVIEIRQGRWKYYRQ
ncbi:MAG: hypothetical protein KDD55_06220 [Bdellovibrionales bacterium]|nr:hypothetical protein [Bdellovibrionales bacterium]